MEEGFGLWANPSSPHGEGRKARAALEGARERIEGLKKVFRSMDRQAVVQAKASPFPSTGGESSLTSGKTDGYKTPEERTDELWPMLNPGQTE